MPWFLLMVAIVAEVIATSLLKSTEGFSRLWPSVVVVVCYEIAFIGMSLSMKKILIGIAMITRGVVVLRSFSKSVVR